VAEEGQLLREKNRGLTLLPAEANKAVTVSRLDA